MIQKMPGHPILVVFDPKRLDPEFHVTPRMSEEVPKIPDFELWSALSKSRTYLIDVETLICNFIKGTIKLSIVTPD